MPVISTAMLATCMEPCRRAIGMQKMCAGANYARMAKEDTRKDLGLPGGCTSSLRFHAHVGMPGAWFNKCLASSIIVLRSKSYMRYASRMGDTNMNDKRPLTELVFWTVTKSLYKDFVKFRYGSISSSYCRLERASSFMCREWACSKTHVATWRVSMHLRVMRRKWACREMK